MAKFRTNHGKGGKGKGGTLIRVGLFAAILSGMLYLFSILNGTAEENTANAYPEKTNTFPLPEERAFFLPTSSTREVIHHTYYSLSYSEEHEQAEWVAYILYRDSLEIPWVDRFDRFEDDPLVSSGSASWSDYSGSGYDRGHLVPAADMAFNELAMEETFYMSNISPQSHDFNKGIWKELESLVRSWAQKNKKLYIITGPVLTAPGKGKIGESGVTIPSAFFKVILDLEEPGRKGIAFVLPNEISYRPLFEYAQSIDSVEELTGINFFPDLMQESREKELESNFNIDLWEFSKQKFEERVNVWNKD